MTHRHTDTQTHTRLSTVTLAAHAHRGLIISLRSTAGTDYESVSGQLEFVPNEEMEKDIPIDIIIDSLPEPPESFNVMFSFEDMELPPGVTPPRVDPAVVTIIDEGMVV